MRRSFRLSASVAPAVLAVTAALLFAGCAAPKEQEPVQDPAALKSAIEDVDRAFMAAFERNDTLVLSSLYTEDAVLLPPNHDPVVGRDSIAAYWGPVFAPPVKSLHLESTEVSGTGGDVHTMGSYSLLADDGSILDRGKYLVLLKRQTDGGWRLYRDMWSSNMPAAPAKK